MSLSYVLPPFSAVGASVVRVAMESMEFIADIPFRSSGSAFQVDRPTPRKPRWTKRRLQHKVLRLSSAAAEADPHLADAEALLVAAARRHRQIGDQEQSTRSPKAALQPA